MTAQEVIIRLLLALILGGIIGAEREFRSKSAGLRTLMLISLGSAVFTMLSIELGMPHSPDRIASNIVTGIGFVGAGVIFKNENRMNGITTAATIWVAAAMGMAIGAGHGLAAAVACVSTLAILMLFHVLEKQIDKVAKIRRYVISRRYSDDAIPAIEKQLQAYRLKVLHKRFARKKDMLTAYYTLEGYKTAHEVLVQNMLANREIEEFEFDENS